MFIPPGCSLLRVEAFALLSFNAFKRCVDIHTPGCREDDSCRTASENFRNILRRHLDTDYSYANRIDEAIVLLEEEGEVDVLDEMNGGCQEALLKFWNEKRKEVGQDVSLRSFEPSLELSFLSRRDVS